MSSVVHLGALAASTSFSQTQLVSLVAPTVVALAGVVIALWSLRTVSRLRTTIDILQQGDAGASVVDALASRTTDIANLRSATVEIADLLEVTRQELSSALRHTAVVRYDAFGDMGGRMSFTAALLDDHGDGLLITSLHGRSETRTYLKSVTASSADQMSPEESEAIDRASGRRR